MTINGLPKTRFVYNKYINYGNPNIPSYPNFNYLGEQTHAAKIMHTLKHLPLLYVF